MNERATKRKRVVLTIEDNLKVCKLAKQNVPVSVLMNQFIQNWKIYFKRYFKKREKFNKSYDLPLDLLMSFGIKRNSSPGHCSQ